MTATRSSLAVTGLMCSAFGLVIPVALAAVGSSSDTIATLSIILLCLAQFLALLFGALGWRLLIGKVAVAVAGLTLLLLGISYVVFIERRNQAEMQMLKNMQELERANATRGNK